MLNTQNQVVPNSVELLPILGEADRKPLLASLKLCLDLAIFNAKDELHPKDINQLYYVQMLIRSIESEVCHD